MSESPPPAEPAPAQRFRTRRSQDVCSGIGHECLDRAALFRGRDPKFLQNLIQCLEIEVYRPGDVIMEEGDEGDKMYFLNRGSVEVLVSGSQTRVATLENGSVFGEMALFGARRRAATIKSLEFCDCRVVNHMSFHLLLQRFPEEKKFFLDLAKERLQKLGQIKQDSDAPAPQAPQPEKPQRRSSMPSTVSSRRRSSAHVAAPRSSISRRSSAAEQPPWREKSPLRRPSHQGARQELASKEQELDSDSDLESEEGEASDGLRAKPAPAPAGAGAAAAPGPPPVRLLAPPPELLLSSPPSAGRLLLPPVSAATSAAPSAASTPPGSARSSRNHASVPPAKSSRILSPRPPPEPSPAPVPRGTLVERLRLGNAALRAGLEQLEDEVQLHGSARGSRNVTLDSIPADAAAPPASARVHRRSSGPRGVSTLEDISVSKSPGRMPAIRGEGRSSTLDHISRPRGISKGAAALRGR